MSTDIKLKRSAVPGKEPNTSILELGEVAINTYDGKMFFKKDDGTEAIVTLLEVTEDNLAIDSSNLVNSSSSTLANVLDDLDEAISTATAGGLTSVSSDSTLNGLGTSGSPLSVANNGHSHTVSNITDFGSSVNTAIDNRVTQSFVNALNVDADLLDGANSDFFLDYTNFTNTPTIPQSGVDFDPVGTDNSTDVTLTGSYDYLTITGQQITLNQVDYNTDISNLPTLYTSADANTDIHTIVDKAFVDALNVDADTLDGANSDFFLDYTNFTNTPSIPQSGVDFDPVGTDNSTDVTLTGAYDYLTITGQQITLNQVDYTTDISNLPTLYTTADANNDIDSRVTQSFVNALNVTAAGVQADSVALGTDTTGNYIASATGGTGVTVTGGTGEGSTPSIAIGQDVSTTANVTFQNGTFTGDIQIDGDFTVSGNVVTINVQELAVEDNLIYLNANSAQTNPDLGWAGSYNDGTYAHAGVFRDASDGIFKVFDSYTPEPDASAFIDTSHVSFALADIQAENFIGALQGNANTATSLETARSIILTGDATGTASFDGTANASITVVIANDSHNHTVSTITDYGTATNTAIDNRVTKSFVDALNVDADTLDGANGTFYLDYNNFTNTPTIPQSGVDFDPVGTDNSTDVTLAGSYDYLTITGQQITLGQVDYNTDISNLPTLYTSTDANTDIHTIVDKAFVDALNVDADTLDGANSAYFLDFANFVNIPDPTITVSLSGDVTGSSSATLTNLANGSISITAELSNTGVTANTYGSANSIPVVTVDEDGRVTNVAIVSVDTQLDIQNVTDHVYVDQYVGNGSNTIYTLSNSVGSNNNVFVAVNGVHQYINAYSVSGSTLTFSEAPANNDLIEVRTFERIINGVEVDHIYVDQFVSDGTTNTFVLSESSANTNNVLVYVNGVQQFTTEYTVEAYALNFSEVPANGDLIEVRTFESTFLGAVDKLEEKTHVLASDANNQILDVFSGSTYRSAKYMVQMSAGGDHTFTEVSLIHDGTTVYLSEYGTINTNTNLGTLDADISNGNVRLLVNPNQANTSIQTQRRVLAV